MGNHRGSAPTGLSAACCLLFRAPTPFEVVVERPVTRVAGTECRPTPDNPNGYCYDDGPAGGWPFAYLVDSPGISVADTLGVEDDFRPGWFLADVAVFGALAGAVVTGVIRMRRRERAAAPGDLLKT